MAGRSPSWKDIAGLAARKVSEVGGGVSSIHRPRVSGSSQATARSVGNAAHVVSQTIRRPKVKNAKVGMREFYASRPIEQRVALLQSRGVLRPAAQRDVYAVNAERNRDRAGLLALARRANLQAAGVPGVGAKPLTAVERHGARVALKRAKRHGIPVAKVLAPFRREVGLGGGKGKAKTKDWTSRAIEDVARTVLSGGTDAAAMQDILNNPTVARLRREQQGYAMGGDALIRSAGGDPAKGKTWLSPQGVLAVSPQEGAKYGPKVVQDLAALGQGPFVGAYGLANATTQAVYRGNLKPAGDFLSATGGMLKSSSPGRLLQGDVKGAIQQLYDHPGIEATNFAGLESVVGRGFGAFVRGVGSHPEAAGVRGAMARAGNTVRPSLALVNDAGVGDSSLLLRRRYSKSLTRKAGQVWADRHRANLTDSEGRTVTTVDAGRRVPVKKMSQAARERALKHRADVYGGNANERVVRSAALKDEVRAGRVRMAGTKTGVQGDALVSLAAEGVLRSPATLAADMAKEAARIRARLRSHADTYTPKEADIARANAKFLEDAGKNKALLARADKLFKVAHRLVEQGRAADEAAVAAKTLHPAVAERSPLQTYALAHMDARYVTVEDHAALERAAKVHEQEARQAYVTAKDGPAKIAARFDYEHARAYRIAVSGKHPEEVAARERVVADAARARKDAGRAGKRLDRARKFNDESGRRVRAAAAEVKVARERVAHHVKERARVSGANRVRRGSGRDVPVNVANKVLSEGKTAEANVQLARDALAEARQRLEVERARHARHVEELAKDAKAAGKHATVTRQLRDATPVPKASEGLRTADGRFLSNEAIREHIRTGGGDKAAARDPQTVGYVPHVIESGAGGNYHSPTLLNQNRARLDGGETRTGDLFVKGVNERSRAVVRDAITGSRVKTASALDRDRLLASHGLKRPDGRDFTPEEATKEAKWRNEQNGTGMDAPDALIPVKRYSARLSAGQKDSLRADTSSQALEVLMKEDWTDRLDMSSGSDRNVVLVPKALVDRLIESAQPSGQLEKFLQLLNGPFRLAVLATNPKWLVGNFLEPYVVRLPLSGAGLNIPGLLTDVLVNRKFKRMLAKGSEADRRELQRMIAENEGGLFVGNEGATVRRSKSDFNGRLGWTMDKVSAGYHARMLQRLPVFKIMGETALAIPRMVRMLNREIEVLAERQVEGKFLREHIQAFTGSWLKTIAVQEKVLRQVKDGVLDPATQARYADFAHETLGQYDKFSPTMRRLVQSVMPFVPWALAAARWVYWTMPIRHSATEALLINMAGAGSESWKSMHSTLPKGSTLNLDIATKDGGWVNVIRYTPYGLTGPIAQGDWSSLPNFVLPQFSGTVKALFGQDPFGRELKFSSGRKAGPSEPGVALYSFLEAMLPFIAQARRLQEGGNTAYGDSTVWAPKSKAGTSHGQSALERTFDPFRATYFGTPGGKGKAPSNQQMLEMQDRMIERLNDPSVQKRLEQAQQRAAGLG